MNIFVNKIFQLDVIEHSGVVLEFWHLHVFVFANMCTNIFVIIFVFACICICECVYVYMFKSICAWIFFLIFVLFVLDWMCTIIVSSYWLSFVFAHLLLYLYLYSPGYGPARSSVQEPLHIWEVRSWSCRAGTLPAGWELDVYVLILNGGARFTDWWFC